MNKVERFSELAHKSADNISKFREQAVERELDTTTNYILMARKVLHKIESRDKVEGAVNEAHRQDILFSTLSDFALCAAHCLLGESVTPESLADRITDLYRRKNADYGDAFACSLDKYGIVAALVRINDKVNRVVALTAPGRQAQVKDESILDTLLDLASYAIMTVVWIETSMEEEKEE